MNITNTINTMQEKDNHTSSSSSSDYHSTLDVTDINQSFTSEESETFAEIHNANSPKILDDTSVVTESFNPNNLRRKNIKCFSFLRSLFSDQSSSITHIRLHQVWPGNNVNCLSTNCILFY